MLEGSPTRISVGDAVARVTGVGGGESDSVTENFAPSPSTRTRAKRRRTGRRSVQALAVQRRADR